MLRRAIFTRLIGACAALTLTVGCTSATNEGIPAEQAMEHIHGLGINPADDAHYAATHAGVYRVGRTAELIGPKQDTMGFTVVGPDHFLASGHPATIDQPNPLGLIESRDGARSWTALDFSGQADFHALDISGPWTYAYSADRGELVRGKDNSGWESLGQRGLLDIAADPDDAERLLVATSDTGQLMSLAVGQEPEPVTGSPRIGHIDYATGNTVVALGGSGEVYVSQDAGESWAQTAHLPGTSQALVADRDRWFSATTKGIFVSKDDGASWKLYYRDTS